MTAPDSPNIYNVDRKQALRHVEQALSEGRIDYEDFDELSTIIAETAEKSQLDEIIERVRTISTTAPQPLDKAEAAAPPTTTSSTNLARQTEDVRGTFSNVERSGHWVATSGSRYRAICSDIFLDLREAESSTPEIHLTAEAYGGNICVVVCPGVEVIDNVSLILSSRSNKLAPLVPGAATIRIDGTCLLGTVKIISRQPSEKLPFGFKNL